MNPENYQAILKRAFEKARENIIKGRENISSLKENRFGDTTYNIDIEAENAIIEEFRKTGIGFT
ncbi:MAG: hypothetical protein QXQ24_08330, partial [Nitrososphaeria archaeon]